MNIVKLYTILFFLSLNIYAQEKNTITPPGKVIAYSPAMEGKYIGSPSICILPDGSYLAAHDFFGKKTDENESVIYKSTDKGKSWKQIAKVEQFWSALFVHHNVVYFIGTIKAHGNYVIRKSTDGGYTWTTPKDENTGVIVKGEFHCAPTPIIEHNGRLWRALEDADGGTVWPQRYGAFLISAAVGSDLLKASSWRRTSAAWYNKDYLNGTFKGWLEGNAVVDKNNHLLNIIRVHTLSNEQEYAAVLNVSESNNAVTFDSETGFIKLPGGSKKFTIRYDNKSKRYWTLVNYVPDMYKGIVQLDRVRNTQVLCSSEDLINWNTHRTIIFNEDYKKHGFQYLDWVFNGKDIIAVSRTAFEDEHGGAQNYHNTNYMTFHRIKKFRKATKESIKVKSHKKK